MTVYQGRAKSTTNSFCTQRSLLILRISDASSKRSNWGFFIRAIILKDLFLSTTCPESNICLPIALVGSSDPLSIRCFGRCSEILMDNIRSVRPMYVLPHIHENRSIPLEVTGRDFLSTLDSLSSLLVS